jgi:hypothetical protein
MNAAMGALSAERSGVGSGLIMALRQVGGTFGVAILGSILSSAYRSGLHTAVVPAGLVATVRGGVAEGVAVAHKLGSIVLFEAVRTAFVHAMDVMLAVCAGIAVAGIVLALAFLPRRSEPIEAPELSAPGEPAGSAPDGPAGVAASGGEGAESGRPCGSGR